MEEVGRGRSNDEVAERGKVGETKDTSHMVNLTFCQ